MWLGPVLLRWPLTDDYQRLVQKPYIGRTVTEIVRAGRPIQLRDRDNAGNFNCLGYFYLFSDSITQLSPLDFSITQ